MLAHIQFNFENHYLDHLPYEQPYLNTLLAAYAASLDNHTCCFHTLALNAFISLKNFPNKVCCCLQQTRAITGIYGNKIDTLYNIALSLTTMGEYAKADKVIDEILQEDAEHKLTLQLVAYRQQKNEPVNHCSI